MKERNGEQPDQAASTPIDPPAQTPETSETFSASSEDVHPGLLAALNASYAYAQAPSGAEKTESGSSRDQNGAPEENAADNAPARPEAPKTNADDRQEQSGRTPGVSGSADEGDQTPPLAPATASSYETTEERDQEPSSPPPSDDGDDDWEDDGEEDEDEEDEWEEEDESGEDRPMTLRDHLTELRKRLVRAFLWVIGGFFCLYPVAEKIFEFLVTPLKMNMPDSSRFIFTSPAEAFLTYMKVSFVASLFATSPLVFYQLWAFIAPGLYKEEKRYILPLAFFSALFFICGGAFCYFVAFPVAFEFFMSFNTGFIQAMPSLKESLSFILQMLLAFGVVFELPLFAFFLSRLGIVTAAMMRRFRRYAILVNVIVAAILTPPDVTSQLLMAGPLFFLYEVSILIAAVFGKKKAEPAAEDEEKQESEGEEQSDAAEPGDSVAEYR